MSSISGLSSSGIQFSGLASGIDTNKVIEGLMALQQAQINRLKNSQSKVSQQQSAFKVIEARLLALQGKLGQMSKITSNVFDAKTVTSSDISLVSAAASKSATTGVYSFRVNSLAKAQQVASQGYDSNTSTISQGTFQFRVGSGATTTVNIDGSNNTLQGLVTAVNDAGGDVSASLVNDGTGSQAYRLLLTSKKGGATNTIDILANGTGVNLAGTSLGAAAKSAGYTGTSTPTSGGTFTGTANNTYTFTVTTGGTVGTDNGIQLSYTDQSGANTGTITVNAADVGVFKNAAQGVQVQFNAGTLAVNDKFTIKGFVPNVQQAADASITIGSGSGAMNITSASNTIDGAFPGVTLNLLAADPAKDVTLTVANDAAKEQTAVTDFVSSFNDLVDYVDSVSGFDAKTNVAGILLGNSYATDISDQVTRTIADVVAGVNAKANRLSAIGITLNDAGKLDVDSAKLSQALNGQLSGVTTADLRRLFALDGKSDNPGVQFVYGSSKTVASANAYQVQVTQAAEKASVLATNNLGASITITDAPGSENNTLTVKIDGKTSSTITLANGTYTQAQLVQELQGKIDQDAQIGAGRVVVSLEGSKLRLTSATYGSTSETTVLAGGTALASLGFAGTESDFGLNVAGNYLVNGNVEAATGQGQLLIGTASNANTADLQVLVSLTDVSAGIDANLTVTRGVASKLDLLLGKYLDPASGRLKTIDDSLQDTIDGIQESIDHQNELFTQRQEALLRQFAAMEGAVSKLKSMGDYLTGQFANLSKTLK